MNVFKSASLGLFLLLLNLLTLFEKCNCEEDRLNWWKYTLGYQIYPLSFKDSDGDGNGDLKGIISKLDYLQDLGVELIWMNPIFNSLMIDYGYDITNFTDIDPTFGTLEDFDLMIEELNKRGMKYMMDFVPNHTSDEHEWFQKSIDRIDPYTDYYIWKDPKEYTDAGKRVVPNNWRNLFDWRSGWKWNAKREQYYYHQFHKKQVDLNLRNPAVVEELKNVIRFWINRGVSGFRLDAPRYYVEDKLFRNEPVDERGRQQLIRTGNQWESYEFIHELREAMDKEFMEKDGYTRIFVPEVYTDLNYTMLYHDHNGYKVTHFPFNFNLAFIWSYKFPDSMDYNSAIRGWLNNIPKGATPNWATDNHDIDRLTDKYGEEITDITNAATLLLPGAGFVYYGQEIGMTGTRIRREDRKDLIRSYGCRDPQRTPMQWDDSKNAGFTDGNETWLPVNTDYWRRNVKQQEVEENSNLNNFKKLAKLKRTKTCRDGDLKTFILSLKSFAFSRSYPGEPTYAVIINFGPKVESISLKEIFDNKPVSLEVLVGSENSGYSSGYEADTVNNDGAINLVPKSCIVLGTNSKPISVKTPTSPNLPVNFNNNHIALGGLLLLLLSAVALILFKTVN